MPYHPPRPATQTALTDPLERFAACMIEAGAIVCDACREEYVGPGLKDRTHIILHWPEGIPEELAQRAALLSGTTAILAGDEHTRDGLWLNTLVVRGVTSSLDAGRIAAGVRPSDLTGGAAR